MEISSGCRSCIALYTSRNTQHSFFVSFVLFLSFFLFFQIHKEKGNEIFYQVEVGGRVDELASIAEAQAVAAATKRVLICFVIYFIFRGRPEKEKKMFLSIFGRRGRRYSLEKRRKNNPIRKRPPLPSIHICTRLWQRKSFVNKSVTLSWETRCGPTRDGNWSTVDTADIQRR